MSGMVLTPVSPTPEKALDRPAQASGKESGAEGFDEVSAREQSRLNSRNARQDRMDKRAEEARVAEKRAEGKKADQKQAEQKAQADEASPADKADAAKDSDKNQDVADSGKTTKADGPTADDGKADGKPDDDSQGDESLPMLFSLPTAVTPDKPAAAVSVSASGESGTSPTAAATSTANGLMLKTSAGGNQNAGGDGGSDGLLQGKADTITTLLGKGATGDAKTADFSAQLARFQGGDSSTQSAPQTNPGQLQQRGLDTMATLKSYSTSVDLPVQHAEWGEKIAGKLAWLTNQRMSAAEIHVTPPDLGPLEVRVQVHHDQAQVTVHATHAAVRDQLELNGHRLRDMLQENGLNLDRFEVSADASGQGAQQQLQDDEAAGGSGQGLVDGLDGEMIEDSVAGGSLDLSWRGEVDLYA